MSQNLVCPHDQKAGRGGTSPLSSGLAWTPGKPLHLSTRKRCDHEESPPPPDRAMRSLCDRWAPPCGLCSLREGWEGVQMEEGAQATKRESWRLPHVSACSA